MEAHFEHAQDCDTNPALWPGLCGSFAASPGYERGAPTQSATRQRTPERQPNPSCNATTPPQNGKGKPRPRYARRRRTNTKQKFLAARQLGASVARAAPPPSTTSGDWLIGQHRMIIERPLRASRDAGLHNTVVAGAPLLRFVEGTHGHRGREALGREYEVQLAGGCFRSLPH